MNIRQGRINYGAPRRPEVRPWVRFWARKFDYFLCMSILILVIGPENAKDKEMQDTEKAVMYNACGMLVWTFLEPFFIATWGTTLGKWFLGITVHNSSGKKLGLYRAYERSVLVWVRGLFLGIPLFGFFAQLVAYDKLKKNGVTTWDRDYGNVVSHARISLIKVAIMCLVFAGLSWYVVVAIEESGW